MIASSTLLRQLAETCPHALDYYERGVEGDTRIFGAGIAAHAVLDAVHKQINTGRGMRDEVAVRIGAQVLASLSVKGRTHNGRQQPTIPVEDAKRGVELALRYLSMTQYDLPRGARPEIGLAVDRDWQPVPYSDKRAFYRGILDLCGLYQDENDHIVLYTRDYKSAWTTGPDAPDTLQLRGQLLLLLAHAPALFEYDQIDIARREVVNLRTGAVYALDLDMTTWSEETFDLWRAEISELARAATAPGPRPAAPGPACGRCPYRRVCDATDPAAKDEANTARRFAVFKAHGEQLEGVLRELTSEEPLEVDGRLLGWQQSERVAAHHEAGPKLWELVTGKTATGSERTLLRLLTTTGGIRDAAKLLHRGPDAEEAREALYAELTVKKPSARWGFHLPPPDPTDDPQPPAFDADEEELF
jgi:hypothetical protein